MNRLSESDLALDRIAKWAADHPKECEDFRRQFVQVYSGDFGTIEYLPSRFTKP